MSEHRQGSGMSSGPIIGGITLGIAVIVLYAVYSGLGGLGESLVYYWSPTELIEAGDVAYSATVRLGGQVEPDSLQWDPEEQQLDFRITDGTTTVPVHATGAPPQMFREGIGVVVEGTYTREGVFQTDRLMVKHSNEYRAPEESLYWRA